MIEAKQGKIPSKQNQHSPHLQNRDGNTVAMLLAYKKIIPPQEWEHDPKLQNSQGFTVALILSSLGKIPSNFWIHENSLKSNENQSIKTYLERYNFIYTKNQYTPNCVRVKNQEKCEICAQKSEFFVKTHCKNKICIQCFQRVLEQNNGLRCPVCGGIGWFYPQNFYVFRVFLHFQIKNCNEEDFEIENEYDDKYVVKHCQDILDEQGEEYYYEYSYEEDSM